MLSEDYTRIVALSTRVKNTNYYVNYHYLGANHAVIGRSCVDARGPKSVNLAMGHNAGINE